MPITNESSHAPECTLRGNTWTCAAWCIFSPNRDLEIADEIARFGKYGRPEEDDPPDSGPGPGGDPCPR